MLRWDVHYWARTWAEVGVIAFLLSATLMPPGIWLLRRLGIVDHGGENKIHKRPVARGGGIIIFLAFAIAVLWPDYRSAAFNGVMAGAFLCTAVGALDDLLGGIPAPIKLGTLVFTTLILWYFGVQVNLIQWDPGDIALTILWIAGVTSAMNGIDNMDGLASGVAAIVAGMFLLIAVQAYWAVGGETSLSWFGMLAAGLIGANLGFLIYNFKPAKIFMGDAGSFFLGFTLASLSVMGEWSQNRIISCTIPILILGVPIFDFAYILTARILRGETRTLRQVIEHCAPDHLSHRLTWIGLSQRKAVLLIYLITIAMGITGILLRNSTSLVDSVLALAQGMAFILIIIILMAAAHREHARADHLKNKPAPQPPTSPQHDTAPAFPPTPHIHAPKKPKPHP